MPRAAVLEESNFGFVPATVCGSSPTSARQWYTEDRVDARSDAAREVYAIWPRHPPTYHRIDDKHLHRYINEFAGRLNMKSLGAADKMRKIVRGWMGKRLTYKQLVAHSTMCGHP